MHAIEKFIADESGQAIMEFFLLMLAVVAIVGTLKTTLKTVTVKLWGFMGRKIAAPCPACDAGSEFDLN